MKTLYKNLHHLFWLLIVAINFSCNSNGQAELPEKKLYEPESIVYSLNLLSNIMFGVDTTYDVLEQSAPLAITGVLKDPKVIDKIGNWSIAWGPVIFSKNSSDCQDSCVVDNLLVLFKNVSKDNGAPDYVLATSGTNDISTFGWFHEDFDAYQMKQWPLTSQAGNIDDFVTILNSNPPCISDCDQSQALVSLGTSVGVLKLLNMKNADSLTIYESLNQIISADNSSTLELRVVGHSLGGALSPALALVLSQYQLSWDVSKKVKVSTAPTAGASPGNEAFRTYFFDQIGVENFYGKMNVLDMVPHAWTKDSLDRIPKLYSEIQAPCIMTVLVDSIENKLNDSFGSPAIYETLYSTEDILKGTFHKYVEIKDVPVEEHLLGDFISNVCKYRNCSLPDYLIIFKDFCEKHEKKIEPSIDKYFEVSSMLGCGTSCEDLGTLIRFLNQAGYQHTTEYTNLFGIEVIAQAMKEEKVNLGISKSTVPLEQQKAMLDALLDYIRDLN